MRVKIFKDGNGKFITRSIAEAERDLSEKDKKKLRDYLDDFVKQIMDDGNVDEDLFIKIVELSPRVNDSQLLNDLIRDAFTWKTYEEDFDEQVDFPVDQYYNELIKKI